MNYAMVHSHWRVLCNYTKQLGGFAWADIGRSSMGIDQQGVLLNGKTRFRNTYIYIKNIMFYGI